MDQVESANLEEKEKWSMFFLIMNIPKVLDVVFSYSHSLTHPPTHPPPHTPTKWREVGGVEKVFYYVSQKTAGGMSVPIF